jgi:hypothetical protein
MDELQLFEVLAASATAIGVVVVAFQFRQAKRQTQTAFEDDYTRQYRDIIQRIPVRALLSEPLDVDSFEKALDEIYNYFDLTNEQIFLRKERCVTTATWTNWCDRIKSNIALPAFRRAWVLVEDQAPAYFEELRRLQETGYREDPLGWKGKRIRPPQRSTVAPSLLA